MGTQVFLFQKDKEMGTLTQERLKQVIDYDVNTGVFKWRINRGYKAVAGSIAGTVSGKGYICIWVDNKSYLAHRLAWLYCFGEMPTKCIDHMNGDKIDNRIINLRNITNAQNLQNRRSAGSNSASGLLGVYLSKTAKKWCAQIRVDGVQKHLGTFETAEDAYQVYLNAKRQLHATCTI